MTEKEDSDKAVTNDGLTTMVKTCTITHIMPCGDVLSFYRADGS